MAEQKNRGRLLRKCKLSYITNRLSEIDMSIYTAKSYETNEREPYVNRAVTHAEVKLQNLNHRMFIYKKGQVLFFCEKKADEPTGKEKKKSARTCKCSNY